MLDSARSAPRIRFSYSQSEGEREGERERGTYLRRIRMGANFQLHKAVVEADVPTVRARLRAGDDPNALLDVRRYVPIYKPTTRGLPQYRGEKLVVRNRAVFLHLCVCVCVCVWRGKGGEVFFLVVPF